MKKNTILFYSKVLYPKIGGYITCSINLIKCLSVAYKVIILIDDRLDMLSLSFNKAILNNDNVFVLCNTDLDKLISKYSVNTIFINATSENNFIHNCFVKYGLPIITYEHGVSQEAFYDEQKDRIEKCNFCFVPSKIVSEEFYKCYPSFHNKLAIVPIPIDTEFFASTSHLEHEIPVFITACMIKPVRNLESLINALTIFKSSSDFQWVIAGEQPYYLKTPYLDNIKDLLHKYDISSNVKFCGGITNRYDLRDYYNQGDIYIDYSSEETYGQAKLEAISCGKPVLMPDIGNNKNLIHKKNRSLLCDSCYEISIKSKQLLDDMALYHNVSTLNREHIIKNFSYMKTIEIIKEYV